MDAKPVTPAPIDQAILDSSAAAAHKVTMIGSVTATSGGFWAFLGENAPQIGVIIGISGLILAIIGQVRAWRYQSQAKKRSDGE